jgi:hypothetical protein
MNLITRTDGFGVMPLRRRQIIEKIDIQTAKSHPQKVVGLSSSVTATVRELYWHELMIYRLARWVDTWEGEWLRNGIYFVLGYREGDFKPRWSPSRLLNRIAEL